MIQSYAKSGFKLAECKGFESQVTVGLVIAYCISLDAGTACAVHYSKF